MRYSKGKQIAVAVMAVICFIAIGFGIYKGIQYSKSLTEEPGSTRVLASVSEKKETKKKTTKKKTTKKTETKKTETKKTETKKTEEKKPTEKKETKKEVEKEYDENREGTYKVVGLKVKNKSYSKEELETLKKAGYSLKLEISSRGVATVSVLSINKMYEFTDNYFYDGVNEYSYSYKKNKLSIIIDDYEIVFEKE